jgi:hypothetical protein
VESALADSNLVRIQGSAQTGAGRHERVAHRERQTAGVAMAPPASETGHGMLQFAARSHAPSGWEELETTLSTLIT